MAHIKLRYYNNFLSILKNELLIDHIDIELTERCNYSCIHCYINKPENSSNLQAREMSTAFIKDVLRQSADLGCLSVRFTGGEPLLREDFIELYVFTRRLGMSVTLFTNGSLIDEELCKLFNEIPPGKPISISVYGMHSQSYDAVVARHGAFKEFWHGINLLIDHDIPFTVKASLLPQNKHEMAEFETFAASIRWMDHKPSYSMNFDLRARRDNPQKNRYIKSLRLSPQETLSVLSRNPEKYFQGMRQFAKKFMGHPSDKLFSCGAGYGTCIDAYGNAQMCMLLRHPDTVYSLDPEKHRQNHPETDLSALEYALKVFFPKTREMYATNQAYLNRCAKCFLKGFCEQCPAKSWEEHGTLDTPVEYLCEVAHEQARYLGLVKEGEKAWRLPKEIWQERLKSFTEM